MATLADLCRSAENEKAAVIIPGKESFVVSHIELEHHIDTCQRQLADLGILPGAAVSICLPNSLEFIITFLATTRQRGIAAPLNPAYKQDEVEFYVDDLDAAAAVMVPRGAHEKDSPAVRAARKYGGAVVECHWMDDCMAFDVKEKGKLDVRRAADLTKPHANDVALVLHTSGTTDRPKLVALTHQNIVVSLDNIRRTYSLQPADRTMLIMPLFHVHGLIASFLSTLRAGSAVIVPPRLAPSFWTDFATHKASWYTATPTMHQILLSFAQPEPMPPVRFIRSCSSPLSPQVLKTLEEHFAAPVLEAYAMTEATHQITSNPLPPAPHVPGSVGVPHGNIEVRILEADGQDVATGNEGEICIRGPSVTAGYRSNSEANASAFFTSDDGLPFFRTGDWGRRDQDGYLYLTGRIKEFINKGGEKISPVEIDHVIAAHPAVADVVTFTIEDDMYGQDIGAAVMLKDGERLSAKEVQRWVRDRVAPKKVPKKVWFPAEIPKTATGKVQRKLVAEKMIKEAE
ncbi:MAG: hypothetical protein OHK93_002096 [Ramalina farinacea]|uniref:Peroxisomal-coenzyme A synthetase n=1 Tax=Ramalina farinacea TaxID=258253 RepID=A0AA43TTG1_9LECA|nr:hypothetical protein [Ramalina farinacea]